MNVQPSSGPFRSLCGSALAYGLTEGSYSASEIKLTQLGRRVTRPKVEDDDLAAKREALLMPRVIREFLTDYNGSPIPKDNIAKNVLSDMGVPDDRTSKALALIVESAESLGLITKIKDKRYVDLEGAKLGDAQSEHEAKEQSLKREAEEDSQQGY